VRNSNRSPSNTFRSAERNVLVTVSVQVVNDIYIAKQRAFCHKIYDCCMLAYFVRNVGNDGAGKDLCLVGCNTVCFGQCLPDVSKQRNILIFKFTTFRYDAVALNRLTSLTQKHSLTLQTTRAPTVLPADCSVHCSTSNNNDRRKQTNKQTVRNAATPRHSPHPVKQTTCTINWNLPNYNVQRLSWGWHSLTEGDTVQLVNSIATIKWRQLHSSSEHKTRCFYPEYGVRNVGICVACSKV